MKYKLIKYLRLSSEDIHMDGIKKHESNSIVNQRCYLDDYISKSPDFSDYDIMEIVDDGYTGTNFHRPGIKHVLYLAELGRIHCIVVKDLSRFGRNHLEVGNYIEQLFPLWGIRFISINDLYDSASCHGAFGGIHIAFHNLTAEMYSKDLSEKIRSAKTTLSKQGNFCASFCIYGYKTDPIDHHKLIIDESAASIVQLIYHLYEQGLTMKMIAHKLNKDGVQTAIEHKKEQGTTREWLRTAKHNMWNPSFISKILRDKRYTGKYISYSPTEFSIPNVFPPIITEDQFYRIKDIRLQKSKMPSHKHAHTISHLFQQKLYCAYCGKQLVRHKLKNQEYSFYCMTPKLKDGFDCFCGNISEHILYQTVLTVIKQQAQLTAKIKLPSLNNTTHLCNRIQHIKQLTEKITTDKLLLWENYQLGNITSETFQVKTQQLKEKKTKYIHETHELESQLQLIELESNKEIEANVKKQNKKQNHLQKLSRELLDIFIKKIYIYRIDRIEIILNYSDEDLVIP